MTYLYQDVVTLNSEPPPDVPDTTEVRVRAATIVFSLEYLEYLVWNIIVTGSYWSSV